MSCQYCGGEHSSMACDCKDGQVKEQNQPTPSPVTDVDEVARGLAKTIVKTHIDVLNYWYGDSDVPEKGNPCPRSNPSRPQLLKTEGNLMIKPVIFIILCAVLIALVAFIWWPDDIITYHGQDLAFRITLSLIAIVFGGSGLIAIYENKTN